MTPEEKLEWCRTIKSLYAGRIVTQAEQIKRLEDALVEERAKHVAASRLTDEQRAAISRAIRCMTDPNYHFAPEERKHVAVLRAMLEEGGQ